MIRVIKYSIRLINLQEMESLVAMETFICSIAKLLIFQHFSIDVNESHVTVKPIYPAAAAKCFQSNIAVYR